MSAPWNVIIKEMIFGGFSTIINMLKILIPLMIIVELLMVYKVMEKLADLLAPVSRLLGLRKASLFPLLVGVVMGVTYGAGTLIEIDRKMPIPKKDFALIGIFMFLCHGIIETTFIFYVAGANIFAITVGRLFVAFLVTAIAARLPILNRSREEITE